MEAAPEILQAATQQVAICAVVPVPACGGRIRHSLGCNGYTCVHLPIRKDNAPLLNAELATVASFAARMAFSSFWIRPSVR